MLVIDSRECKLIEILQSKEIEYKKEYLDLGDIMITTETSENNVLPLIIFERKTWSDLKSSIKDGRFREQRSRLQQLKEDGSLTLKIIYIIEGAYSSQYELERKILLRLLLLYDYPIIYTCSVYHTVEVIKSDFLLNNSLLQDIKTGNSRDMIEDQVQSRVTIKKTFDDPKIFFYSCLYMIKGVSFSMANAIGSQWNSLLEFYTCYLHDHSLFTTKMNDIQYSTPNGNMKKLNTNILNKIMTNFQTNFEIVNTKKIK